jgi:hypothetical protein
MHCRYRTVGDLIRRKAIPGSVLEDLPHCQNEVHRLSLGTEVAHGLRQICIDCWNEDPDLRPSAAHVLQKAEALLHPPHNYRRRSVEEGREGGDMRSSPQAYQGLNMIERVKRTIKDSIPQYCSGQCGSD